MRPAAALILLSVFLPPLTFAQAGPAHFSSTGEIHGTTATGGWSSTPDKCRVDATPTELAKLFTLLFNNSPNLEGRKLDWPDSIAIARQGRAYTAHIQNDDGTMEDLNAGNCKVFQVNLGDSSSRSGPVQGLMSGSLKLDCTEKTVHITTDLHFTNCR